MNDLKRGLLFAAAGAAVLVGASGSHQHAGSGATPLVEVVVGLEAPPLAHAAAEERTLYGATRRGRLNLRAPASVSYVRTLAAAQARLERRLTAAIPQATVRWRYRIVANALAVVVPERAADRLAKIPGVARVYPTVRYRPLLDQGPRLIGAPTLWEPGLRTAGQGIKIGIVDDGVDHTHPFFDPTGYTMPAGFPKGQAAYTTPKVIAARAFPPPSPRSAYGGRPVDPQHSSHATHVAGIAAGNNGVSARGRTLSGVAPRAYIGNYKVLTVPTAGVGLNGNSPEIAAGIEAAVRDGMDVINLSLGQPEIEPSRDLVAAALNAAADAGVVPTVAAGNDYEDYGRGSLSSPGSAVKAITAGAVSKRRIVASFSSSGPTPVSLRLKPDVTAPGENIISSVPPRAGLWEFYSGTSMAAPHVAGAAALLRQRHPTWSVAQVKSALVVTGDPVAGTSGGEAPTTRAGGGLVDLVEADAPLVFTSPTSLSLGLVRRGRTVTRTIAIQDAGGGAGEWTVFATRQQGARGVRMRVPADVTVPGSFRVSVTVARTGGEQEITGFIVLTRAGETRRVPYWFRVTAPRLRSARRTLLRRAGTYRGDTRRGRSRVSVYRYPDNPGPVDVTTRLTGPEQVFRVRVSRPLANFGVAIIGQGRGVVVEPRIVVAGDENRLAGYAGLPVAINPYLETWQSYTPIAGAVRPKRGFYDVVFDSITRRHAGAFTFRFWVSDSTPPSVRLVRRTVASGGRLVAAVRDRGSGVDPRSLVASVDGRRRPVAYSARTGQVRVLVGELARGAHRLLLQVSDRQEAKNMENVPRILPNTRRLTTTFTVR